MHYLTGFLTSLLIILLVLVPPKTELKINQEPSPYVNVAEQLGDHYRTIYSKRSKAIKISNELNCLADNVYQEAGYEPIEGQLAVATVVINRMKAPDYPKTICGVVYERHFNPKINKIVCQFSWTCKPRKKPNKIVYQQAKQIAREVMFKHHLADLNGATLYHAVYVHPDWADKTEQVEQIGAHVFYKE